MGIRISREGPRGCGHRKPGGLYLVTGPSLMAPCARLPLPLNICPTCGAGIHPARGWTWVDPVPLFGERPCRMQGPCGVCPLAMQNLPSLGRMGLLWIGEAFYATPADWMQEALTLGVSRRIHAVPRGFKAGETWVLVAHRKAITERCPVCHGVGGDCPGCDGKGAVYTAAIFHAFRPTAVEYVVTGEEGTADLNRLEERGLTLVKVIPQDENQAGSLPLFPGEDAE